MRFWLQLTSLPFVCEPDATDTGGTAGTGPVNKCQRDPNEQCSAASPANTTEVLLLGLRSGTWYKATVYSQAEDGTEGQPTATEFRTGMLGFDQNFQHSYVICDSGSELALASQAVFLSDGVFWKRLWTEETHGGS